MKYLAFLLLILTGCNDVVIGTPNRDALVSVTCYDKDGKITVKVPRHRGEVTMVNDHTLGYWSQKCVIERL